ncbi:hypothetical protein OH77DRAFT_1489972 [Trametes cingulata]|nr:hypothetical protein OH77DRAFT_1489972 [Trametes cingulata]
MPELDTLAGFEFTTQRLMNTWVKKHKKPFEACLRTFPRAYSLKYTSCTVEPASALFDYEDALEPCPEDFVPSPYDTRKADGRAYARYLKPLTPGELFVKARGKEIIFAAGHHALRVHFGLEGTIATVPTSSFEKMVLECCPGNNPDEQKANNMRSFRIPPELIVPEARGFKHQKLVIFAALVNEEHTIIITDHYRIARLHIMSLSRHWTAADLDPASPLWGSLWSTLHGPDWIYETKEAEAVLDRWRAVVLSPDPSRGAEAVSQAGRITRYFTKKVDGTPVQLMFDNPELNERVRKRKSLLTSLTALQFVFNGFGQHTAHDLLHSLALWPGMSPYELCRDDELYAEFKLALSSYASQFVTKEYRTKCLSSPNRDAAFYYNYKSEKNYINSYCKVYRKVTVRMPADLYNKFAKRGLFNAAHMIGKPYNWTQDELLNVKYSDIPVLAYKVGGTFMYSVIQARRPVHWRGSKAHREVPSDVRLAGFMTTIGPASFALFKQNQWDTDSLKPKRGRRAVERTGKPGRPPRKHLDRKAITQQERACRAALAALETMTVGEGRPTKRRKIAQALPIPTDRQTRSSSGAATPLYAD